MQTELPLASCYSQRCFHTGHETKNIALVGKTYTPSHHNKPSNSPPGNRHNQRVFFSSHKSHNSGFERSLSATPMSQMQLTIVSRVNGFAIPHASKYVKNAATFPRHMSSLIVNSGFPEDPTSLHCRCPNHQCSLRICSQSQTRESVTNI